MTKIKTANLLKLKRKNLGLSQGQIASKAGCNVDTISKLERGLSSPTNPTILSLLKYYDITYDEFLEVAKEDLEDQVKKKYQSLHTD